MKLSNLKGTKDYMPESQRLRNRIREIIEDAFMRYGFKPLETPILCEYELLASKYAGGAEILKEVYKLTDQGSRDLGLRYDLTVPFAKVIGMNPQIKMPFKRYEIGKVFRDGPVKKGRLREFMQCDADMVGVTSQLAESELISLALYTFDKLGLDVIIELNNRKLLTGVIMQAGIEERQTIDVILTLDKLKKLGKSQVKQELIDKGVSIGSVESLFEMIDNPNIGDLSYWESKLTNIVAGQGIGEIRLLNEYLEYMGLLENIEFNPFLARGLEIYTGSVYEIFLKDASISSSIGSGGRYNTIIGGLLDSDTPYPAVGISFGLDVIYEALLLSEINPVPSTEAFIIPLGTEKECLKLLNMLRKRGYLVEMEMLSRRFRKSLDYANKEGIPYVIIMGDEELANGVFKIKCMDSGKEVTQRLSLIYEQGFNKDLQGENAGIAGLFSFKDAQ